VEGEKGVTTLITLVLSYIGGDILVAILARVGIGGAKAAAVATVVNTGTDAAPVLSAVAKALGKLHKARAVLPPEEHAGVDEAIGELSAAQESLTRGFFK